MSPLWGVGEYRTANLSVGRSGAEQIGAAEIAAGANPNPNYTNDIPIATCTHLGNPHLNKFYHVEPPIWLKNRDANRNRQTHMKQEADGGLHTAANPSWTTTETSGSANATHTGTEDPMGVGTTLESIQNAADDLNQVQSRGINRPGALGQVDGSYPDRLTKGSRGNGYHYEYEYIDSSGNHRRRFEQLVATSTDLEEILEPNVVNVDWNQSDSTT